LSSRLTAAERYEAGLRAMAALETMLLAPLPGPMAPPVAAVR
jgi:hypothetical protein